MNEILHSINESERGGLLDLGKALRRLLELTGAIPPGGGGGDSDTNVYFDSAADLATQNPVMPLGSFGYETDTFRFKFADGTRAWNALPYQDQHLTPVPIQNPGATVSFPFRPLTTQSIDYDNITVSTTLTSTLQIPSSPPPLDNEGIMFVRVSNSSDGTLELVAPDYVLFGNTFEGTLATNEALEFSIWVVGGDWFIEGNNVSDLEDNSITNAHLVDVVTSTIKGRLTAGTGDVEDLTVEQVKAQIVTTGSITNAHLAPVATSTLKGRLTVDTGAVEDLTIAQVKDQIVTSGSITNANLATVATGTIKGRLTAGTGAVEDLTVSQVSGAILTDGVITNTHLADVATGTIRGRLTAATGDIENLTIAQVKASIDAIAPAVEVIAGNTTLVKATHQDKTLVCDAALSLTVDNSTDFDQYRQCIVWARGGAVTIVNTATVNTACSLTMPQNSVGILQRETDADTYVFNWMGRPSDMVKISPEANNTFNGFIWVGLEADKGTTAGTLYFTT